jgi:hypothetical protein
LKKLLRELPSGPHQGKSAREPRRPVTWPPRRLRRLGLLPWGGAWELFFKTQSIETRFLRFILRELFLQKATHFVLKNIKNPCLILFFAILLASDGTAVVP